MPPILITKYEWSQNDSEIHIKLPLKHVKPSKTSIITTEKFLKIHFVPYLFQLVLHGKVDPTRTRCIFKDYEVIVELKKSASVIWESLSQSVDNRNLVELEKQVIFQEHENIINKSQVEAKEKCDRKNIISTYQINVNKEERDIIEQMKSQVKRVGFQELIELKHQNPIEVQKQSREKQFTLPVPVPLPRNDGVIQFISSQRLLPSPRRASRKTEEEEWLRKKTEAMKMNSFIPDDLSEEERNPTWLLEKGMSFLKNDNFLGAINAFSYGCCNAPSMPIFYLRLAQTQLKVLQYCEAIGNCDKALELLQPFVENNKSLRRETYQTRAAAYQYLNKIELSAQDYRSAKMLD